MTPTEPAKSSFLSLRVRPWGLITSAGIVAGAATLLGFLGSWSWAFDLCAHFRVQYFLGLTAVALILLIPRQRKEAAVFGVLAVVNLCTILPLYLGNATGTAPSGPSLRAMLINVNTKSGNPQRVTAVIRQYDPAVLVLEEVSDRWVTDLRAVFAAYPYTQVEPRDDNFGIALLSRFPFTRCQTLCMGTAEVPSILAEVQTPQGKCTILATHPVPPAGRTYSQWRNRQLAEIPEHIRAASSPALVIGDLNVSPWSSHFRRLLRASGLRDSSQGRGVQPTWPTFSPLMRIPIDHCLFSPGIRILSKEVGPRTGSDHFPVIVDFWIER